MADEGEDTRGRRLDEATGRVMDLEAELEISGNATTEEKALARARAVLHEWVDSVVAVVSTPGSGRAVLIHENGKESRISSPELPYRLSVPVTFAGGDANSDDESPD